MILRRISRSGVVPVFALGALLLSVPALAQVGPGFSIAVDGGVVAGDPGLAPRAAQLDAQLARADLRIQYDGLETAPRLVLYRLPGDGAPRLRADLNYPAFINRAELRLYQAGPARPRLVQVQPVQIGSPIALPDLAPETRAVLRVYDARGRYDESSALTLGAPAIAPAPGADMTARRGIRVFGGAVTVSGRDLAPGARVTAFAEEIPVDGGGRFALQRILPPGSYAVDLRVTGAGAPVEISRPVDVPRSDWFYVASADLTYALRDVTGAGLSHSTRGRLAGYVNGRFANGVELTAQLDSAEVPLGRLLSDLDARDPRSLFLRVDPDDLYPTYGDGSTLVDDTPTSGRVYLRIERDGDYVLWGDYKASLTGGYLRNERALYGLSAAWQSDALTGGADPRASAQIYAAQPERVAQRDILRGTGGSVYFLNRQDISIGSETVTIQLRDRVSGRVVETRRLVAGVDYAINYIQGVVTLREALSGGQGGDAITRGARAGRYDADLVVNYEFSPSATDLDAFAYGGRAEGWITDQLRIGAGTLGERRPDGEQRLRGVDLYWQIGRNSSVSVDYAQSVGPGPVRAVSTDGGLRFDQAAASGGSGRAYRMAASVDLADLGVAGAEGVVSAYREARSAGFTSLDYAVAADESLWGLAVDTQLGPRLSVSGSYDSYDQQGGKLRREGVLSVDYALSPLWQIGLGVAHRAQNGSEAGRRSDVALRLRYGPDDDHQLYGFVQRSVARAGALAENHRVGIGGKAVLGRGWSAEGELSQGSLGAGARILLRHESDAHGSRYLGYELEPDRELSGVTLAGVDRGHLVYGWERDYGGGLSAFGEHGFDMFGTRHALSAAYGLSYQASAALRYGAAFEYTQVDDPVHGDFTRSALSFGADYTSDPLSASGRVELRRDLGHDAGSARDSRTVIVVSDLTWHLDDARHIIASLDAAHTQSATILSEDGDLVDLKLGYAFRPVLDERLNILMRYRFVLDTYGRQSSGAGGPAPRQRSHVLSAEASYDLSETWTLGGKLGLRASQTATDRDSAWVANDATLAVANLRYHFAHNWDALIELRGMHFTQSGTYKSGAMGALYRHLGPNLMLGVGVEYGTVSSDLTDFDFVERGGFVNLVASF